MKLAAWLRLLFLVAASFCLLSLLGIDEDENTRGVILSIPAMGFALRDAVRGVLKT